jgi:hypothetical protein
MKSLLLIPLIAAALLVSGCDTYVDHRSGYYDDRPRYAGYRSVRYHYYDDGPYYHRTRARVRRVDYNERNVNVVNVNRRVVNRNVAVSRTRKIQPATRTNVRVVDKDNDRRRKVKKVRVKVEDD